MNRSQAFWGALVLTTSFLTVSPIGAQSQRLEIPQARAYAAQLLQAGQPGLAKEIAGTLLEADPNDVSALLILSRAERFLRNYKPAAHASKKAFRLAEKPEEKYFAAILTAQALSANDQKIAGQIWLRRAAQAAPNERLKAQAVRDLRFVRQDSPFSLSLDLALAPSSNVNNGSKSDTMNLGGLAFAISGDARALSGIEARVGARLGYRFRKSQRQSYFAEFSIDTRSYSLSSSAKAIAPNASGSDYNFQEVDLTFGTQFANESGKGVTTLAMTLGKNWFGGSRLTEFARATASHRFTIGQKSTLSFTLSLEEQWRQDNALRDATSVTTSVTWNQRLESGAILSLTGYQSDTNSVSSFVDADTLGASVTYRPGKPIFGKTRLELSLGYETKDFNKPVPFFGFRDDRKTTASATMVFGDVEYFGFSPTATIQASRNKSTLAINETEEYGVSLGLRSSF